MEGKRIASGLPPNRREASAPQDKTSLKMRLAMLRGSSDETGGAGRSAVASAGGRGEDGEHDQLLLRVVANPVGDSLGRDQHLARLHGNLAILG